MTTPAPDPSTTQRALLAIQQLQARLAALEAEKYEPIAIVGMGCRFPGSSSPAEFWQQLESGQDAITEIPGDRWNVAQYYSHDPAQPGKMYTRHGGFVPQMYEFDAPFFRISPREALSLDPQQRLLLEVSWEALEHAGIAPDRLQGQAAGVFVGLCGMDYWHQLLEREASLIDAYLTTGNTHSTAAGRLSYLLGVTGPSVAIDAACASSLVAVHLASQSLRQWECDLAVVGGVNSILSPETTINFCKAKMLSPTGRCRSFDAEADGFVRSEGCGVVVLKRCRDAVAAGDTIHAVILGSATNHDGRSSGLTVPNGLAQQAVIRQALTNSRIAPSQVSYVEAHGTGTVLGDAIELEALEQVFGDRPQPLWVGSVKTNIGHLEAACGIAGLMKVSLALQHHTIPAHLHFCTPSPKVSWDTIPLRVPTTSIPWTAPERMAGVSAFGFNGTNAHVVVAAPPPLELPLRPSFPAHLLTLSARSEPALTHLIDRYLHHLRHHPNLDLANLCWTANTGRPSFAYRLAILAQSLPDLLTRLTLAAQGQPGEGIFHGRSPQELLDPVQVWFTSAPVPPPAGVVQVSPQEAIAPLQQVADRYVRGSTIHWRDDERCYAQQTVPLPTYPFQRQRYSLAL